MSMRRTHPLEWAALAACIVALSYTEWSLAVAAGAHPVVAVSVPAALDIYAIRAMRVRRHVSVVVLAMVGVNALSYLVHAGVVPVSWPVLIIVSAIAPLVFWAVHQLGHVESGHTSDTVGHGDELDVPVTDTPPPYVHPSLCGCTTSASCPEHAAELAPYLRDTAGHAPDTFNDHVDTLPVVVDRWDTDECVSAVSHSEDRPYDGHTRDTDPDTDEDADTPALVLELPEGFEKKPRRTRPMLVAEGLKLYGHDTDTPSIRQIKEELGCRTDGAQAVLDALAEKKGLES